MKRFFVLGALALALGLAATGARAGVATVTPLRATLTPHAEVTPAPTTAPAYPAPSAPAYPAPASRQHRPTVRDIWDDFVRSL